MEPRIVAHIVCSSLSLACICVQSLFLVRFAIRLEDADRKDPSDMGLPRPPTKERRAKQILPAITAASGLAYCCCNLVLRGRGSQHAVGSAEVRFDHLAKKYVGVCHSHSSGVCGDLQREQHHRRSCLSPLAEEKGMGDGLCPMRCRSHRDRFRHTAISGTTV